jgi:hypothetical protein
LPAPRRGEARSVRTLDIKIVGRRSGRRPRRTPSRSDGDPKGEGVARVIPLSPPTLKKGPTRPLFQCFLVGVRTLDIKIVGDEGHPWLSPFGRAAHVQFRSGRNRRRSGRRPRRTSPPCGDGLKGEGVARVIRDSNPRFQNGGLMKAIPGFHPTGVLRTSNFAPGEIVDKPPKAAQIVVAKRRRPEGRGRSPSNPSLSANNEKGPASTSVPTFTRINSIG